MINLRTIYYLSAFLITAGLFINILYNQKKSDLRREKRHSPWFPLFYLFTVLHLGFITLSVSEAGRDTLHYLPITTGSHLSRIRFLFFILFAHNFTKSRFNTWSRNLCLVLAFTGTLVLPRFFTYWISGFTTLIFLLWIFAYWGILLYYQKERVIENKDLLKKFFFNSSIMSLGLILDISEDIWFLSPWISFMLFDFFPLYFIILGVIYRNFLINRPAELPELVNEVTGITICESFMKEQGLSPREREVIPHILKGESNKDIAETLCISESTVKKHINNIFRKTGIKSRWELLKLTNSP